MIVFFENGVNGSACCCGAGYDMERSLQLSADSNLVSQLCTTFSSYREKCHCVCQLLSQQFVL